MQRLPRRVVGKIVFQQITAASGIAVSAEQTFTMSPSTVELRPYSLEARSTCTAVER
jgi:hypothetical protein